MEYLSMNLTITTSLLNHQRRAIVDVKTRVSVNYSLKYMFHKRKSVKHV